jgi:hypothetical protein
MLLPPGKTPAYLGHAVAMLIYHDFARFQFAKDKLPFRDDIIRYGDQTGPLERDPLRARGRRKLARRRHVLELEECADLSQHDAQAPAGMTHGQQWRQAR